MKHHSEQTRMRVIEMTRAGIAPAQQAVRLGVTRMAIWKLHYRLRRTGRLAPRDPRRCAVSGCERRHRAGGYCLVHYQKARAIRRKQAP